MLRKIVVVYLVLFTFLTQVLLSGVPAYAAGNTAGSTTVAANGNAATGSARRDLQDSAAGSDMEQEFRVEYIRHIRELASVYQQLRQQSARLISLVEKSKDTELLNGSKLVSSDAIAGLKQRIAYLTDKVAPVQKKFYSQEEGLEKDLAGGSLQADIASSFQRAQLLGMTYTQNKKLLEMEDIYLTMNIKTLEMASSKGDGADSAVAASLKTALGEYRDISSRIQDGLQQIDGLEHRFALVRKKFNKARVEQMRKGSQALGKVIAGFERNIDVLRNSGEENAVKHAELLTLTLKQLISRKKALDAKLMRFNSDYEDIGGNFIYIPEGLGNNTTKSLVSRLEAINTSLVKQTFARKRDAAKLAEKLDQLYQDTLAEQEQAALLFAGLPEGFSEAVDNVGLTFDAFIEKITGLQADIAEINKQFSRLGSENSKEIIHDYKRSYQVVRLNQGIEKVVSELRVVTGIENLINLQVAVIISQGFDYDENNDNSVTAEQVKPLLAIAEKRTETLEGITDILENINSSLQKDIKTIKPLRALGADIFKQYRQESEAVLPAMQASLEANLANKTSGYHGYLQAVYTSLKGRAAFSDAIIKQKQIEVNTCPSCDEDEISLWRQTAYLNQSYPDMVKQIEDLAPVAKIFAQQFIPEKLFTQATNLFVISQLLNIPVDISVQNNGVNIEFLFHGKGLRVKGLGNPSLDLVTSAAVSFSSDYFSDAPYIGGFNWPSWDDIASTAETAADFIGKSFEVGWNVNKNIFKEAFIGDNWFETGLKIGGYVLAGATCVLGAAATFAASCGPLIVMAVADTAQGYVTTGVQYGLIPEEWGEIINGGIDVVDVLASGGLGLLGKVGKVSKLGKIAKILGLDSVYPKTIINAIKGVKLTKLKDLLKVFKNPKILKDMLKIFKDRKVLVDWLKDLKKIASLGYKLGAHKFTSIFKIVDGLLKIVRGVSAINKKSVPKAHPAPKVNTPKYHPAPKVNTPKYHPAPKVNTPKYHPAPKVNTPKYHPAPKVNTPKYRPAPKVPSFPW